MRLPSIICIVSLVSLVLGAPVPEDHKPDDIVCVPRKHLQGRAQSTAPNRKNSGGTFDIAHVPPTPPKVAPPHQEDAKHHSGSTPNETKGQAQSTAPNRKKSGGSFDIAHIPPTPPKVAPPHQEDAKHHSGLTPNETKGPASAMIPEHFEQFPKDREAKLRPASATGEMKGGHTGEKSKERTPSPAPGRESGKNRLHFIHKLW